MRAVVARAFGPPESFSVEVLPMPQPGRGQVRIAIRATGVSFVDAVIASGGITDLEDVRALCKVEAEGIIGAITGRAVYQGTLDFAAAQKLADKLSKKKE